MRIDSLQIDHAATRTNSERKALMAVSCSARPICSEPSGSCRKPPSRSAGPGCGGQRLDARTAIAFRPERRRTASRMHSPASILGLQHQHARRAARPRRRGVAPAIPSADDRHVIVLHRLRGPRRPGTMSISAESRDCAHAVAPRAKFHAPIRLAETHDASHRAVDCRDAGIRRLRRIDELVIVGDDSNSTGTLPASFNRGSSRRPPRSSRTPAITQRPARRPEQQVRACWSSQNKLVLVATLVVRQQRLARFRSWIRAAPIALPRGAHR